MSSIQQQAQEALRAGNDLAVQAIDAIPPDAWPVIDIMMRVLIALALVWLVIALIAWWRRRAYNLTIAATARRNRKNQPGFLTVDHKARAAAIARGEAHAEDLDERDEAEAALAAADKPLNLAGRLAQAATFIMSIVTLLTGFSGAVFNVTRMGADIEQLSAGGKLQHLVTEYPLGCAVAVFVIGYNLWRYIADKKWKEA